MADGSQPRQIPQNLDAEQSVLGGVLNDNACLLDVSAIVKPEEFYRPWNQRIFAAMIALNSRGSVIRPIDVAAGLGSKLGECGGDAYLELLDTSASSGRDALRHAAIVKEMFRRREILVALDRNRERVYEGKFGATELIDLAQGDIFGLDAGTANGEFTHLAPIIRSEFVRWEALYERQEEISGIPSGLTDLDRLTAGWQNSDLIIIAARPSQGKTAICLGMGEYASTEAPKPVTVGVFSLEMSKEALGTRLVGTDARVDGTRFRNGGFQDSDWPKLARSSEKLFKVPFWINDSGSLSATEMRAIATRQKQKHGLDLMIVDYLQLMRGSGKDRTEEEVVSSNCRMLKLIAKELGIPVIVLSQLNRSLERREDKRPQLSDLRSSGAIEQHADVIMFIYNDSTYNKDTQDKGVAELIISKHRNGPCGTVRVRFAPEYTRFDDLEWSREQVEVKRESRPSRGYHEREASDD